FLASLPSQRPLATGRVMDGFEGTHFRVVPPRRQRLIPGQSSDFAVAASLLVKLSQLLRMLDIELAQLLGELLDLGGRLRGTAAKANLQTMDELCQAASR